MIIWGVFWAIVLIAIVAAIFVPMFNPAPKIEDSQSTEKIEKSMKYDKCIEDVESEVNTLMSYSKSIAYSDPEGAKVVLDEAKYALEKGEKKCKEDKD